jgi:aminoglycoside 6'-N-acetyltransferase
MSEETGRISLVEFDPDGYKLMMADWLRHPHARQWWGDPAGNLHQAVDPDPGLGQALIQADERPVGYLRWQRLSRSRLATIRLAGPTDGVIDIDVLIGEPGFRGRGVAAEALRQLSVRLLADPTVDRLVMCMSVENHPGVRAAEKAGFVRSVQYEDPEWGPCWVLVCPDKPPTGHGPALGE